MRAKMALALTGLFTLGCTGMCSGLLDKVTGGGSGDFMGCPEGTVAYDGWSSEYPDPILQVNESITVDARTDVCEHKASLKCTVRPGLYHPWSRITESDFKTVGSVARFVTLKEVKLWDMTLPEGTEVIQQFYAAEGQCGLIANGKPFQDMCPGNGEQPDAWKALPMKAPDFQNQQYVGVDCAEGHKGWVHISEGLMGMSQVQTGEMLGYGEVGPAALADGSPSPLDPWSGRRADSAYDLRIPESEGPFWVIAIQAGGSEKSSKKKVDELRAAGFEAHIAWLGGYGSAKYKELWVTYIGPYAYSDRSQVEMLLPQVKSQVYKKAYGVTLGASGEREQIK